MTLQADNFLDRIKLKKSLSFWRTLAIFAFTSILVLLSINNTDGGLNVSQDHIARVSIDNIIFEDAEHDKILSTLRDNNHVRAVIVYINSPGGTIVGGENLYHSLRAISEVKPVVAVMGSIAASGGYMAAIATDRIFARAGTITGSVGVLLQSFDITELGNKLGVGFVTFKSGKMKATPSPLEKLDPESAKILNSSISDSFDLFLGMVIERRSLGHEEINQIKDGRVFTGRQALQTKLVDAIGGQDDAIKWLEDEKGISKNLKIIDVKLDAEKKLVEKLVSKITGGILPDAAIKNGGLMALWKM